MTNQVEWCSWLSRQSNTLKVSGSSPGSINFLAFLHISVLKGLIFFLFLYTEYVQFDIHCLALRVGFGYVESELRYESYANSLGCSIASLISLIIVNTVAHVLLYRVCRGSVDTYLVCTYAPLRITWGN